MEALVKRLLLCKKLRFPDISIPKALDEVLGRFRVAQTRIKAVGFGSPRVAM